VTPALDEHQFVFDALLGEGLRQGDALLDRDGRVRRPVEQERGRGVRADVIGRGEPLVHGAERRQEWRAGFSELGGPERVVDAVPAGHCADGFRLVRRGRARDGGDGRTGRVSPERDRGRVEVELGRMVPEVAERFSDVFDRCREPCEVAGSVLDAGDRDAAFSEGDQRREVPSAVHVAEPAALDEHHQGRRCRRPGLQEVEVQLLTAGQQLPVAELRVHEIRVLLDEVV